MAKLDWLKTVEQRFYKKIGNMKNISGATMHLYSDQHEIDLMLGLGDGIDKSSHDNSMTKAYHAASVGKLFTASIIGMIVDQGNLSFEDRIVPLFEGGYLDGLFVYKGVDYQEDVTVEMLLSHWSGCADYIDDKVINGPKMLETIVREPDIFYTPNDLIEFSRLKQKSLLSTWTKDAL